MKKVAIIHPHLIESGGSEARALYIAEALKEDYDVTLITTYASRLERLNEYYGTNITQEYVKIVEHPFASYLKRIKYFDAIRGAIFSRFTKTIASSFGLLISTYNVMDFGKKGIQFIADFSFSDELRRKFTPSKQGLKKLFYNKNILRRIYLFSGNLLCGTSPEGYKKNLTVANSMWTAKIMKEEFGIDCKVIYPPVIEEFPEILWNEKEDGFVYIGRLVPEKRVDFIISILDRVRKEGYDIHLHIVGHLDNSSYVRYLKKLVSEKSEWIELDGAKYKEEKQKFLSNHKYGINARSYEPFGISVAELVKAGCIVWVPDGGGQTEIVKHQDLLYSNFEDAVAKIVAVLKNGETQKILRTHLATQAKIFSVDKFKKELKELLEDFFKNE